MQRRDLINAFLNLTGESLWGLHANLIASATVLIVLLSQYGAGPVMIGAVGALENGAILFPQILGMYIFTSRKRRKKHLVLWYLLAVIPFVFLMGLLTLFAQSMPAILYRWGMIAGFAGVMIMGGAGAGAWVDWVANIFDIRIRGTAIGMAMFGFFMVGTGGTLLAGWLIHHLPSPGVYAGLYLGAGVIAAISLIFYLGIDDSKSASATDSPPMKTSALIRLFSASLRDRNFRSFLTGRALASAGFCIVPFIAVRYTMGNGALSSGGVVACGAAMTIGNAMANLVLGRMGDRYGHRLGILIGAVTQSLTLLVMLFSQGQLSCILAYAGAGIALGSGIVSHMNMLFETCPHESRLVHITTGNLIVGFVSIVAPLATGALVGRLGLTCVFQISLALSLAAILWVALAVKEPRQVQVPL